jgi:hypothetical protein
MNAAAKRGQEIALCIPYLEPGRSVSVSVYVCLLLLLSKCSRRVLVRFSNHSIRPVVGLTERRKDTASGCRSGEIAG